MLVAVLILGYGAFATFVQHPNEQLAKVANVSITRSQYEKLRRYDLFQQMRTSQFFQQQGTDLSQRPLRPHAPASPAQHREHRPDRLRHRGPDG